jgi:1,4-dihydroxy-2-naphthoate octaprenyltransferase
MFQILNGFVADAETLMQGVILVLGIAFVGATWWRTKAMAPTLGAVLLAAIVVFAVNNFQSLSEDVERDVNQRRSGRPAASADERGTGG